MATASAGTFLPSPCYYHHLIRPAVHDHTASRGEDTGFRQAGLPVHAWKLRKTINTGQIKYVAMTVVKEAKVCTPPTCVKFDLGLAPVYWKTSDGLLPSFGGKLTLFHNPLNKLVPDNKFGIAFNGGFNQPIMCKGEPRAMGTNVRGKAVNLVFSFTNGVKWGGLYKLQFQVPKNWRNKPISFFNEGTNRLITIGLIISWYASNIGVLLLNKYLLGNYGFRYPIFLTMCHMIACSLLSYVAIVWMRLVPMQPVRSQSQFFKIAALSAIFCASVVSGNVSLRYLPVSFNQAIGATTPFFTAVFAYLMTAKREAWLTYVTLVPVITSVVIASGGEPSFHLFGFVICVLGVATRALKSVVQGIILSSDGDKLNSMNLLLYMAPIAVVFLLPATLTMEKNVVGATLALARDDFKIIWYLLFNSTLAYFVNLTNFLVTKHTSALTLQVLGNAKCAVAVVISILIFRNPVSVTGMLGYTLTVIGVLLYTEAKKRNK